ncbi:hypothetical protein RB195_026471 [Necator americanus]|uniref:G-protein coupled receptors family 1 profile domain-containing protein n=1 Tax=Necator americanus TaxID=51031 RepID=A0ABR1EX37_NECAM
MQSPCHILIAFTCFSDLLHELGQYPFVYHFYNRSNMPQHTCLYLQLIPVYGACIGSPLILSLGVDRLIAISFPSRYRFLQTIPYSYVACQLTLPMAYTIYLLTWALVTREDSPVQCSVPQAFGSVSFALLNQIGFAINVIIVILYCLTYFLLRKSKANSKMRTVFKSIFVTVAIVIVGWFATFLVNTLSFVITEDPYVRMVINMYAGITVNIGLAANVFVYYAINSEYRAVIKQMFGRRFFISTVKEISAKQSTMHGLDSKSRINGKKSATILFQPR